MNDAETRYDDDNNVRVCIRIRPLNQTETERGDTSTCSCMSDGRTLRLMHFSDSRRKWESQTLKFDRVFGPEATQIDVFHHSGVEELCDAAADGYAATVFCFGQTGSGKTYTMTGPIREDDPNAPDDINAANQGIQFRALHYFARLQEQARQSSAADGRSMLGIKAAMYEIYNEQVNDLLNETCNLKVRWTQTQQGFFIESLMLVQCDNLEDLLAVLQQGLSNRKRSAHLLNQDSSRSHVILSLGFERQNPDGSPPRLGKLNLVDLAGSEKLKDSGSTGSNATETKNINQSLLALGKVISALAARSNEAFVPYRDSTLTRLLMDSLGGNAKTLMMTCVTPSSRYVDESIKTIRYAVRASSIVNMSPTVRIDPRRLEVFELRTELESLKKENSALRERLMQYELGTAPGRLSGGPVQTPDAGVPQVSNSGLPPRYKPPFLHQQPSLQPQQPSLQPQQQHWDQFQPRASEMSGLFETPVAAPNTYTYMQPLQQFTNYGRDMSPEPAQTGANGTQSWAGTPQPLAYAPGGRPTAASVEPNGTPTLQTVAPKKAYRLGPLASIHSSSTTRNETMESTNMTAPNFPAVGLPGVTPSGTIFSTASAPAAYAPRHALEEEVRQMNQQLQAAQRELMSFRSTGGGAPSRQAVLPVKPPGGGALRGKRR